ncbi:ThiF family adenylyltransferase [Tritonibacter mobilis]|uniref:ThiF family adenylyltransferase n=1 Tax=Tritonibacter mobilis TaxID=379347 RepID=UPI000806B05C|nr:ThiF family adenylyltransferase [Tritonibacter mobilis]
MDIAAWLSDYPVTVPGDLQSPAALALVNFVQRHAGETAAFVEARRGGNRELILLDFQTGRPQRPAYPIKHIERIAVRFADDDAMPLVYVLRPDFPDTPHQQLTLESTPRAICIDDRFWSEAQLTWTPAELVQRVLKWFERAAQGTLHDARQPLDPLMMGSGLSFIISRRDLAQADTLDLVGEHDDQHHRMLRVKRIEEITGRRADLEPISLVAYKVAPENMQRLTFAPDNLGSLAEMLAARGIDLFSDLRQKFNDWLRQAEPPVWRINGRFAVIVEMPIIAPDGAAQNGTDLRAFLTAQSVGAIAAALGIAEPASEELGSKVGYVARLICGESDDAAIRALSVQSAEIHYEFDRTLATQLGGRNTPDIRNVVLVGAGAVGSHLADCLGREGRFHWTIIDDDRVLPHNLARHIARGPNVTAEKAALVAAALNATIDSEMPIATFITSDVMTEGEERARVDEALNAADIIIDATASLVAGRYLSDHPSAARRVSAFFNPTGTDAVVLAEPNDRSLTLRDLEAHYYALVSRDQRLSGHLSPSDDAFAYTGACRAITNLMPESNVMTLSGLLAGALGEAFDGERALLKVWSLQDNGALDLLEVDPPITTHFEAGDWRITIDRRLIERILAMRSEALPDETGGVLTGLVDIPQKSIHLADAASSPADSQASPGQFVRGTDGVREYLDDVFARTRGQVRYVGEWHSHPPNSAASPSATDLTQVDWLSTLFELDTLPALMLIAGEKEIGIVFAKNTGVSFGDPEPAAEGKVANG